MYVNKINIYECVKYTLIFNKLHMCKIYTLRGLLNLTA